MQAAEMARGAEITGGDLALFRPRGLAGHKDGDPLLAFSPVGVEDELRVPITVPAEDYYDIQINQVSGPQSGSYVLLVDGSRVPDPIGVRWPTVCVRARRWAQVRLTSARHVLRFRKHAESANHTLAIARITLKPGGRWSFFYEAERLSAGLRPTFGSPHLSGYAELVFAAGRAGESLTLRLPEGPPDATHLAVALVGGPDRGIARFEVDGRAIGGQYDTSAKEKGRVCVVATLPLEAPAHALAVKSAGGSIGIDGVAFGVAHTFEAEWLPWQGSWRPHPIPYSTGSGRASDQGYVGADCRDLADPLSATLDLPWEGRFLLQARIATAPGQGTFQFQFDDRILIPVIDTHAAKRRWPAEWATLGAVSLRRQKHVLRIWCRESDAARRRIRIDAIRFVPKG